MAAAAQYGPFSSFAVPHVDSPWPTSATVASPNMLFPSNPNRHSGGLSPANKDEVSTPQSAVAPSPSTSETETVFTDLDAVVEQQEEPRTIRTGENLVMPSIKTPTSATSTSSKGVALTVETGSQMSPRQLDPEEEDPPQSVIHVPSGFASFVGSDRSDDERKYQEKEKKADSRPGSQLSNASTSSTTVTAVPVATADSDQAPPVAANESSDSEQSRQSHNSSRSGHSATSDRTVTESEDEGGYTSDRFYDAQVPPTPLQTSLPSVGGQWTKTPRAQTRQDLAALGRPGSSLASIIEGDDYEVSEPYTSGISGDEDDSFTRARPFFRNAEDEIAALKSALAECWTLCNTLANLSYIHRERIFTGYSSKDNMQGQAWRSCWKLCQNLYDSGNELAPVSTRPTLDLCREFCQTLFEVRVRDNQAADSVLRVSFELNNHLFNTHDRMLPEAFRERTLDFYITLCHRLMKQKTKIAEEPDSLLRACWSLAEMLFSLRQRKREGKKPDEELLGSAIQACWDLCDLFREGWTQIRPERGTPRPSHTTFTQAFNQARRAGYVDESGNTKLTPETPTTIFEDNVAISPDEAPVPNIMVLRSESMTAPMSAVSTASAPPALIRPNTTQQRVSRPNRWNSVETVLSGVEGVRVDTPRASSRDKSIASSHTVRTPSEDPMMTMLKALFVRAAIRTDRGFQPDSTSAIDTNNSKTSLPAFIRTLPETAFGTQSWQMNLFEKFKSTISHDPTFKTLSSQATSIGLGIDPSKGREEIAMAVRGMIAGTYGWTWLRDLYRYGFGFYVEEVLSKEGNNSDNKSNKNGNGPVKHRKINSKASDASANHTAPVEKV